MSFGKMIELLQKKNKNKIILVNAGHFYIARGKDAVLLHEILNLKVSCMEAEICKVGFPISSLDKYTQLIEEQYSYIVYNYDNKIGKLKVIKQFQGKNINTREEEKLNCYICTNTVKIYKKNDIYIQAVADLYKEEYEKEQKIKQQEELKKQENLERKIKDDKLMWLIKEILYAQKREKVLEIRKLYITNVCKYILK